MSNKIKLIILDVDGTLTNGEISYTNSGDEVKNFNVKDGFGIAYWNNQLNYKSAIITGRKSNIVEKRVNDLNIDYLYQNEHSKEKRVQEILDKENFTWDNVAIIGDDLNDYKMLIKAGLSFCPNDAASDIVDMEETIVCKKNGGVGCVREMIDYIIKYNKDKSILDFHKEN